MVNRSRSRFHVSAVPLVCLNRRLTGGALGLAQKNEKKKRMLARGHGPKVVGPAHWPNSSAQLAGLGWLWLGRPARVMAS
jgi:hypothetical protein